ncbi:MAG: hypothetical protein AMJ79_14910 [Phycisphaerae bacterium SM23_30]|nr:MAG: hypothetical protein AMJ79_14910 [Phycisphaerae bacterium SM23_30]
MSFPALNCHFEPLPVIPGAAPNLVRHSKIKNIMIKLLPSMLIALSLFLTGCVERLITVDTSPAGALVWLNGREIGNAPVTVPFTWYGQYEVVLRKDGFQALKTSRKADAPFYQWPPLDLFAECLLPLTLTDHHHWHFQLAEQKLADPNSLIQRAQSLRRDTLIIR